MSIGDTDFGVQASIGITGKFALLMVSFIGAIVLARILGPVGYGSFYVFLRIAEVLNNPVTGWGLACRKRLTEDGFPSDQAFTAALLGVLAPLPLLTLLVYALNPILVARTGLDESWTLLIAVFAASSVFALTFELVNATGSFGASSWIQTARDVIRVIAQISLVLLGFGVVGMIGGLVIANVLIATLVIYFLRWKVERPAIDTLKRIGEFAKFSIPSSFIGSSLGNLDVLLFTVFGQIALVGNYEIALMVTMPALFIMNITSGGLVGRISNLHSRNVAVFPDVQNSLSFASLLAIPLLFGSYVIGKPVIITLYSDSFRIAGEFLVLLAAYRLLDTQSSIYESVLLGFDKPRLNFHIKTVTFVLNIVSGVFLYYQIGPIGIPVATVASAGLMYALRLYYARQILQALDPFPRPIQEQVVSGLIMFGAVYGIKQVISLGSPVAVAATTAVGVVVYFGLLTVISHDLRHTVRSITSRIF